MKRKKFLIGFLFIGAISILIMSLHYFFQEDSGILRSKVFKDTLWYRLSFLTHITSGLVAISVGPFQFSDKLVLKRSRIHRKLGYIYVVAVAGSSITGLLIAQFAMGGIITRIGFSTLSVLWLFSLTLALKKVLAGDTKGHKRWMQINYALTFSSITQRTILLFAFIPSISFMPVYQLSSWLSWTINLTIILLLIRKESPLPLP